MVQACSGSGAIVDKSETGGNEQPVERISDLASRKTTTEKPSHKEDDLFLTKEDGDIEKRLAVFLSFVPFLDSSQLSDGRQITLASNGFFRSDHSVPWQCSPFFRWSTRSSAF